MDFNWLRTSANRQRIRFANLNGSLFNNDPIHIWTEKIQTIINLNAEPNVLPAALAIVLLAWSVFGTLEIVDQPVRNSLVCIIIIIIIICSSKLSQQVDDNKYHSKVLRKTRKNRKLSEVHA